MQFIRLSKPIDIAERVLPDLVADGVDTYSMQSMNSRVLPQFRVYMLVPGAIKWWRSGMPHWFTFSYFTHHTWAIWELSKHDLMWVIPYPGSQKRVILSLESICTIPFQTRTSNVKISRLRPHSLNQVMACFIDVFGIFWGSSDQPHENLGTLAGCLVDIVSNITDCEIWWPSLLIARKLVD